MTFVLSRDAAVHAGAAVVGGKGAKLAELSHVDGPRVPNWFCVTTAAYRRAVATPWIEARLAELAGLRPDDTHLGRELSGRIRAVIEATEVPDGLARELSEALEGLGGPLGYAVRSSATAEDLPMASFAGQHDSFSNVPDDAVLDAVRRCWASLFTERAVAYRIRHGIDHRDVDMAVIVQEMVPAEASGVAFTANPVTGDRRIVSIEATVGLGAGVVAGTADADRYEVRDGRVISETVAAKKVSVVASADGGTRVEPVEPSRQRLPALTERQVLDLSALARRIEAHFGCPQDLEWCSDGAGFLIVQSRPITALFPAPETDDATTHVYISVGHQQMMTEPMTPLGLSVWQLTSRAPMRIAGGRLYVDVTGQLSAPASRAALIEGFRRVDPLTGDALATVVGRDDVIAGFAPARAPVDPTPHAAPPQPLDTDPAIVAHLVERDRRAVDALEHSVQDKSGIELIDHIASDLAALREHLSDPRSHQVILAGMEAARWLNDRLEVWLGEKNPADVLSRAAPGNVTTEMGLALLDVADAVRPHPEVVSLLRSAPSDGFLDTLAGVPGGDHARAAIESYLDTYGVRCAGEIDIGRPRWRESPAALLPMILSNVDHFEAGEHRRRVARGRREAAVMEREILRRLRRLPDGSDKAAQTERMIRLLRTFTGYREYPKYGMVRRYAIYRQALLSEARRLVDDGALNAADDIVYLRFDELREVVRTRSADQGLVARRRADLRHFATLRPPRVLTSDGEAFTGTYEPRELPAGALVGLAVSSGTVEGRARVVADIADADLVPGDILVTAHTDPSWAPVFVTIAGLVTEAGGLMTHGAVVAREYGIVAVVGVEHATSRIPDGAILHVDGTNGYVEIVAPAPPAPVRSGRTTPDARTRSVDG